HYIPKKLSKILRIPSSRVILENPKAILGFGKFCTVQRGSLDGKTVAIKELKHGAAENEKQDFLQEAIILDCLHHPNIIQFLGICLDARPYMMVLEYINGG